MRLKKYLSAIRDPSFLLYKLSKSYVRTYEGYSYRFSKNSEARLLEKLGRHNIETVFNVGANVGDWSVLAASIFPNADIHAFELSETTFCNLKRTANINGFKANGFGLSNRNADIAYRDYGEGSTVNTMVDGANFHDNRLESKEKRARVMRGDDYCSEFGIETIDLLKIDVEGAEHLRLKFQMQHSEPFGHRMLRWTYETSTSAARTVA
jgi:FkbM family methyltransferase